MKESKIYGGFADKHHMGGVVSLEELEEKIEQEAREEEADNIVLAEDRRVPD